MLLQAVEASVQVYICILEFMQFFKILMKVWQYYFSYSQIHLRQLMLKGYEENMKYFFLGKKILFKFRFFVIFVC